MPCGTEAYYHKGWCSDITFQALFSIQADQSHSSIVNPRFHYFIYYSLNVLERGPSSTSPSQLFSPGQWRRPPSIDWYAISSLSNTHLVQIVIRYFPLVISPLGLFTASRENPLGIPYIGTLGISWGPWGRPEGLQSSDLID